MELLVGGGRGLEVVVWFKKVGRCRGIVIVEGLGMVGGSWGVVVVGLCWGPARGVDMVMQSRLPAGVVGLDTNTTAWVVGSKGVQVGFLWGSLQRGSPVCVGRSGC